MLGTMLTQTHGDLVLDVGNSRMKMGLFVHGRIIATGHAGQGDVEAVREFLAGAVPRHIAIGSVAGPDPAFQEQLQRLAPVTEITGAHPSPLGSLYTSPHTLGVDRLANAVAAALLFPRRAVLAIDLGSCLTCDVVDALAVHRGGIISPGLHMRAKAMHAFSARLPLVELPREPAIPGTDTTSCLAAGAFHGLLWEIMGHIAFFRKQHRDLAVVITGGDALRFARALKSGIFAHPTLTLIGLHALLHFVPERALDPLP